MNKLLLMGLITLAPLAAQADRCTTLFQSQAQAAIADLQPGTVVVEYYSLMPQTPPRAGSVLNSAIAYDETNSYAGPEQSYYVLINGETADIGYLYIRERDGRWRNLGQKVGCEKANELAPYIRYQR
jgi:hypothetical protein